MKIAQIEIMGLAMVMILIIVSMAFATKFLVEEPIGYKKQFAHAEMASNTVNAFLGTTSDCNGLSMAELLQDCSKDKSIICDGEDSCNYASAIAQQIFMETLEKWNVGYAFKVFNGKNAQIIVLGKNCPLDKKSKLFPMPTDSGVLFVSLDICG